MNDNHRQYRRPPVNPGFVLMGVLTVVVCLLLMWALGAFGRKQREQNPSSVNNSFSESSAAASEEETVSSLPESSSQISSTHTVTSKPVSSKPVGNIPSSSKVAHTTASSQQTQSVQAISAMVPNGDWRLVVANKQYPLPESYRIDVGYASGNYRLDKRIIADYQSMIAAAKQDGIVLSIISGFRTYAGQTSLYNRKVNQYLSQGYSKERANELAAQVVAPPGTSEHLTGLAVDLISTNWYSYNNDLNERFEQTPEFQWLYSHCAQYGFVLRYPKDKVAITGYSYEPWHYRYVGREAAADIMSRKICLEEYVGLN